RPGDLRRGRAVPAPHARGLAGRGRQRPHGSGPRGHRRGRVEAHVPQGGQPRGVAGRQPEGPLGPRRDPLLGHGPRPAAAVLGGVPGRVPGRGRPAGRAAGGRPRRPRRDDRLRRHAAHARRRRVRGALRGRAARPGPGSAADLWLRHSGPRRPGLMRARRKELMRVAVPDLISNSYFPAVAAVEMGFFKDEGLDADLELLFPVPKTMEALRDGQLDFVAGAAHAPLAAFPDWQGARLLAALAQRMYWLLVLRADLGVAR